MSKARRDTNSFRCSVFWNGQANSPEQRKRTPSSPAELISRTTGVFSGHGHFLGNAYSSVPFGRFSGTMPSTCGITSPARWIITVSPMRTSSRAISSALCSVAFCTITPPTPTGSSFATGVSAPVRPTWISMSRTTVVACSAGNLCATAQRGLRETKPSRSCQSSRSTL